MEGTGMDANEKIAYFRLSVLELAERLGNVSQACRERGMTRTQFYKYKRRYEQYGLEGLKNLPPIHKSHPHSTPPELMKEVLDLSLKHPGWGCVKLSQFLKSRGKSISSPTIQNILIKNGLGTRAKRLSLLQKKALQENINLSQEQIGLIEKENPCFRERFSKVSQPGQVLVQTKVVVAKNPSWGELHLHVVVDSYSNYVFSSVDVENKLDFAVCLVRNNVLPFFKGRGIDIQSIFTDIRNDFFGGLNHSYRLWLLSSGIKYVWIDRKSCRNNGFLEGFINTATKEFFRPRLEDHSVDNLERLPEDFNRWLIFYNTQRAKEGYPNMGKTPAAMVEEYYNRIKEIGKVLKEA
jgi:hypothetical protein